MAYIGGSFNTVGAELARDEAPKTKADIRHKAELAQPKWRISAMHKFPWWLT
jgi:hypothetical protein